MIIALGKKSYRRVMQARCVFPIVNWSKTISPFSAQMTKNRYLGNESSQRSEILNIPGGHRGILTVPNESRSDHAHFRFERPNAFGFDVENLQDPSTWNLVGSYVSYALN